MKIKTNELTGAALDWAVEYTLCLSIVNPEMRAAVASRNRRISEVGYSTDWSLAGPILTRERISRTIDHSGIWVAYWTDGYDDSDTGKAWMQCDRSELVAGLRCYVESEWDEEIEVPDEFLGDK